MKHRPIVLLAAMVIGSTVTTGAQDRLRLTGSGASFPFPLYATWFKALEIHADPAFLIGSPS